MCDGRVWRVRACLQHIISLNLISLDLTYRTQLQLLLTALWKQLFGTDRVSQGGRKVQDTMQGEELGQPALPVVDRQQAVRAQHCLRFRRQEIVFEFK